MSKVKNSSGLVLILVIYHFGGFYWQTILRYIGQWKEQPFLW